MTHHDFIAAAIAGGGCGAIAGGSLADWPGFFCGMVFGVLIGFSVLR